MISNTMKKYLQLIIAICLVMIFVFYLSPLFEELPLVESAIRVIDENEIDATALYYTEINEFSIAELNIVNTLCYSPIDSAKALIVDGMIE
jgi:hypothetical protein